MCIMGSVFLRKTYLGRRDINKSLSHSFSILKNLVNVSSQTMCMLKMCNLIRYDRLCSKCDNSKGMSKHNISLLPWKMFAMEQRNQSAGIYCLCHSQGKGRNGILGESFGELIWVLQLSPRITRQTLLVICRGCCLAQGLFRIPSCIFHLLPTSSTAMRAGMTRVPPGDPALGLP